MHPTMILACALVATALVVMGALIWLLQEWLPAYTKARRRARRRAETRRLLKIYRAG